MTYMGKLREQERQKRIKKESENRDADKEFEKFMQGLDSPLKRRQRIREGVAIEIRKDFEAGKMHPLFLLWHTAALAFSFTFFMALFSADSYFSTSLSLQIASVFFSLSIVFNGFFCLFYQSHNTLFKINEKDLYKIHSIKLFEWTRNIGLSLTVFGMFSVIYYFSVTAVILSVLFVAVILYGFVMLLPKKLIERDKEILDMKINALKRGDDDLYTRLCRLHDD